MEKRVDLANKYSQCTTALRVFIVNARMIESCNSLEQGYLSLQELSHSESTAAGGVKTLLTVGDFFEHFP